MQRIIIGHDLSLPPDRVFAYMGEHENLEALFGAKIVRMRDGTDGQRNGVGSVRQLKGTHLHYEIRFRGVVPGLGALIAPGLRRNIVRGLGRVDSAA